MDIKTMFNIGDEVSLGDRGTSRVVEVNIQVRPEVFHGEPYISYRFETQDEHIWTASEREFEKK